jgi:hypothetical protein
MTVYSSRTNVASRENSAEAGHKTGTHVCKKQTHAYPFTLAAPSFVIPAGAAENSRFLANYFDEIALLFFETEACLSYTDDDLPKELASLPVSWHVHLPLDLPWQDGLDMVWQKITGLMEKAAYLRPHVWVLHPPTEPDMLVPLAARFRKAGIDPADILLENVDETDLAALWPEAREGGYSTCLDLGHILAYGQHSVLELDGVWDTVRMLHVYAPVNGGRHTGLGHLDIEDRKILREMLAAFKGEVVTLEVFNEAELFQSVELFDDWTKAWSA